MAGCITKWVIVILGRTWLVASSQGVKSVEICASQRPTFSDTLRPVSNVPDLPQCIHLPWTCVPCTRRFRFNHTALTCFFFLKYLFPFLFPSFPPSPLDSETSNSGGPKHTLFGFPRGLGSSFQIRICFRILQDEWRKNLWELTRFRLYLIGWNLFHCKRHNRRIARNYLVIYLFIQQIFLNGKVTMCLAVYLVLKIQQ